MEADIRRQQGETPVGLGLSISTRTLISAALATENWEFTASTVLIPMPKVAVSVPMGLMIFGGTNNATASWGSGDSHSG
jgi:hypothetical protein